MIRSHNPMSSMRMATRILLADWLLLVLTGDWFDLKKPSILMAPAKVLAFFGAESR